FIMKDLKKYRWLPHWLESSPQFFNIYPELMNDAGTEFLTVDGVGKREKQNRILKMVSRRRGLWGAALDALKGGLTLK
ncbi:hypothetical protein KAR10_05130, partial [bacterium]|nr:hypothetical protein [bacterium]